MTTEKNIIIWRFIQVKNNTLHLEGKDNFWLPREKYCYFCKLRSRTYFPKYIKYSGYDFITMYGIIEKGRIVSFDIPLQKIYTKPEIIHFYISYMGSSVEIFPTLGLFSHIPPISNGYYIAENFIIKYIYKRLMIFQYKESLEIESEKLYSSELKKIKKDNIIYIRKKFIKKSKQIKKNKKFEIWLINDKPNQANDNGEYFFRFLKSRKPN